MKKILNSGKLSMELKGVRAVALLTARVPAKLTARVAARAVAPLGVPPVARPVLTARVPAKLTARLSVASKNIITPTHCILSVSEHTVYCANLNRSKHLTQYT
jgi:hypothetical protein